MAGARSAKMHPVASHQPNPTCRVCPYARAQRCEGLPEEEKPEDTEHAIGCSNTAAQVWYYEDLHEMEIEVDDPPRSPSRLPAFIPVLVRVMPKKVQLPELPIYGVSYTTVLRNTGAVRYANDIPKLRQDLGLGPDARVCLIGTGADARLEHAWETSKIHELWHRLANLDFDFVTTTTFSVWDQQPRFDQIYNQERNLCSYVRFTSLGIPTVPFLFYRTEVDLRRHVEWLERHEEVDTIAVLAQFYRRTSDFKRLLEGMQRLVDHVERGLRFLVTGCATADKIEILFSRFPSATVVSTKPVMQALHGRLTTSRLAHQKKTRAEFSKTELLARNISTFYEFCQDARRQPELPA